MKDVEGGDTKREKNKLKWHDHLFEWLFLKADEDMYYDTKPPQDELTDCTMASQWKILWKETPREKSSSLNDIINNLYVFVLKADENMYYDIKPPQDE